MRIVNLTEETRKNILKDLLKRSPSNFGSYADTVEKIVNDVRDRGDEALFGYTKQFDKADINAEADRGYQKSKRKHSHLSRKTASVQLV